MGEKQEKINSKSKLRKQILKTLKGDKRNRSVHVSELAQRAVSAFGGSSGFAAKLASEYEYAPAGSHIRAGILKIIGNLITQDTELSGQQTSTEGMTDDDLQREFIAIQQEMEVAMTQGSAIPDETVHEEIDELHEDEDLDDELPAEAPQAARVIDPSQPPWDETA